jgi:hypothetical protein
MTAYMNGYADALELRTEEINLDKISENGGEIVYKDSSFIKAIFLENKIEQAVKSFFEITERRNQKAELSGGTLLTVFQT